MMSDYIDDRDESFFNRSPVVVPIVAAKKRVTKMTASELADTEFPEVNFIVPNLIPPGLTLLASSPKIGKSWMVLHIGDAVSSGGKVFGEYECSPGSVLYLALEDNLRRMKSRLDKIGTFPSADFVIETDRIKGKAGIAYIEDWLKTHLNPKLIIIDTFGRFRGDNPKKNQGVYDSDTDALAPLQNIASQHNLAIILVHHTKKGATEDFTESVSGSRGLTGVADTIMKLDRKRGESDAVLEITGRDIEEQEIALRWDAQSGLWGISGSSPLAIQAPDTQKRVLTILKDFPELGLSVTQVATILEKTQQNAHNMLTRMKETGLIEQIQGRGSNYRIRSKELW